ncbi:hypothetical protein F5X68DRAFT_206869 [Plectosphaerella plurivora]|uniref:C2H2-type domain-containing protein n=1 Tax=Plectosphaerella plurivora TaxID=936078 RepID=A0A9P8VD11_9PEZI|nr:hypothetical protein F5X68DRAFT_206869 [Plectosphaerella plurivora]
MASSKEMPQTARPLTQHRSSLSTASASASGLMSRQTHSRTSSHSILGSALNNANHRVTRRKSMTNTAANVAAVAAAFRDISVDGVAPLPIGGPGSRRNTSSKSAAARAAIVDSLLSPPASLPAGKSHLDKRDMHESAIDDDPQDGSADEDAAGKLLKARARRASDGQPLTKERRKSNRAELRCDKCGKGYKHSSCLTKHLWEHTPEWSYTSKLLISKHQQVQLLEAASVLVAMNVNVGKDLSSTPPESTKDFHSEPESAASPAASAYSGSRQSSADTTPPPQIEGGFGGLGVFSKRYSSSSGFGRSYQSAPSTNPLITGSVPESEFSHFRRMSHDRRPPSSGRNNTGQDDRELAAAVELLSCSFNSNNGSRTVNLPADVPPVPPLPTRYLDQAASLSSTGFLSSYPSRQPESFTRGEMRRDAKGYESDSPMDDDDFDVRSRSRSDEDDDGVFGRMEE